MTLLVVLLILLLPMPPRELPPPAQLGTETSATEEIDATTP